MLTEYLFDDFCGKLSANPSVESYIVAFNVDFYYSDEPGLELSVKMVKGPMKGMFDSICIDLLTGEVFCSAGCNLSDVCPNVVKLLKWYKKNVIRNINMNCEGDNTMSKKEINETIRDDIQKLASDLTKKREMEKASSSAEDIAKKLGVKLPKSKK